MSIIDDNSDAYKIKKIVVTAKEKKTSYVIFFFFFFRPKTKHTRALCNKRTRPTRKVGLVR